MESQNKYKNKLKCINHGFNVQYFQVKGIEKNQKEQSIFYCLDCAEEDKLFDISNYIQFRKFMKSNINNQINIEWPPCINQEYLKIYKKIQLSEDEINSYENEIIQFYNNFKEELIKSIDLNMKKQLEQIRSLKDNKQQLIQKYIELTKIDELKNILNDNCSLNNVESIEQNYLELLKNVQLKSNEILNKLIDYGDELTNNYIFNQDKSNQIKESILFNISQIDFLIPQNISIHPLYRNYYGHFSYIDYNNYNKIYSIKENIPVQQEIYKNNKNEIIIHNNNNKNEIIIHENNNYDNNNRLKISPNVILQRNNSYIFRIKIEQIINGQNCYIGLIFDKVSIDKTFNYFFLKLKQQNNQIRIDPDNLQQFQQINGNGFVLSDERMIEIRININKQQLEYLDYPHYHYKIGISNYQKDKLQHNNYKLFFSLPYQNQIINLGSCYYSEML